MNTEYIPTEEELTAYALGEVDHDQSQDIEHAVANQPDTKALLKSIRETIDLSEGIFSNINAETLSDIQRETVETAATNIVRLPQRKTWQRVVGYAAAAGIFIMVGATVFTPSLSRSREAATRASSENMAKQIEFERQIESNESGSLRGALSVGGEAGAKQRADDDVDGRRYVTVLDEGVVSTNVAEAPIDGPGKTGGAPQPALKPKLTSQTAGSGAVVEVEEFFADNNGRGRDETSQADPRVQKLLDSANKELQREKRRKNQLAMAQQGQSQHSADQLGRPVELDAVGFDVNREKSSLAKSPQSLGTTQEPLFIANAPSTAQPQTVHYGASTATAGGQSFEFRSSATSIPSQKVEQLESLGYLTGSNVPILGDEPTLGRRFAIAGVPPQDREFIAPPPPPPVTPGTEAYESIVENRFKKVSQAPLSTFSIDVDTASYSNMRRFITQGQMPPADSVRIEELINYFNYDYPQPMGEDPFSSTIEVSTAPWNPAHKLVCIGLKGKDIVAEERPSSNLVFLLDVSGSMSAQNKLPLVKQSIRLLTQQLTDNDRVAIVVYAGNSGLVLPSTRGDQHAVILDALNRLKAGGSTNGGAGIQLAYDVASRNFIEGGVNRVILASDGDFNVGTTSRGALVELIEHKVKSGVFLTVLGYGMGNLKDATMENLADKGNGNYAYIDTFHEAKKVLADELNATLFTIAKDVKIQVEFNPNRVHAYRLIGYENRALANRDFNDDTKDAGEIGAGHTVTALYEIVPTGVAATDLSGNVDELRYKKVQQPQAEQIASPPVTGEHGNEMLTLKLRYKQPDGNVSKLLEFHLADTAGDYNEASADFKFATAVAAFGMKLRNSPFAQSMSYDDILRIAESGRSHDLNGYRSEFIDLVRKTKSIAPRYRGTRQF